MNGRSPLSGQHTANFWRSKLITGFDGMDDGSTGEDGHNIHDVGDIEAGNEIMDDQLRCRLYQAALKGDWKTAESIEAEHPRTLTKTINDRKETVLHIATRLMKTAFVKKLVEHLDRDDLALKNKYGNTALCIAAASGAVDIVEIMVAENENLTLIRGSENATPLLIATSYGHKHLVSYLLPKTPIKDLELEEQMKHLVCAISADYYDIALLIFNVEKSLALKSDLNGDTPLNIMARKSCINSSLKCIYKKTMMQIQARQLIIQMWEFVLQEIPRENLLDFINCPSSMLHDAARVGNVDFLRVLIHSNPDLAWKVDKEEMSIFHVAVKTRQESVFSLIYEKDEFLDNLPTYVDDKTTSLLELAARKPDRSHLNQVSGAGFQMLRELMWFKEVEKIENLTMGRKKKARELFTKQHKDLVTKGEKWMEKTANFCMMVATLIAAIVFAAGFTLPGGFNSNTGSPLFLHHKCFTVFVISDAIALISSSTSILMFLSILMSGYAEDDFLFWLPFKLVLGLGTLFFSALTMMMTFSASFFLLYGKDAIWVPLVIVGMGIVPVYCLFMVQFKLWADIIAALRATWRCYFLFRNRRMKVFWMSNIIAPLKKFYDMVMSSLYKIKQQPWWSQSATALPNHQVST